MARGLEMLTAEGRSLDFEWFEGNLEEFLAEVRRGSPDLVLLDCALEVAFEALREIRKHNPECRCVIWSDAITPEYAFEALRLGVRGILRKSVSTEALMQSLREVSQGHLCLDKTVTDNMGAAERVRLSAREAQLIRLLAQGLKNKEIANALRVTEGTVKVYLSRLFQRAGVKDRLALASFGIKAMAAERISGVTGDPLAAPTHAGLELTVTRAGREATKACFSKGNGAG